MAFATNQERLDFINFMPSIGLDFTVQIVKNGRESEIFCDDFEHAMDTANSWKKNHGAESIKLQRVNQLDGSLFGGIGEFV